VPDAAITDAERDRLFNRLGVLVGLAGDAHRLRKFLHQQNGTFVVEKVGGETADEDDSEVTAISITECVLGTDTNAFGFLFGSLVDETPVGGATVNLYLETARSTLVATGTAANGAAATLTAQAGYTLAGTVTIGTIGANRTFMIRVLPPLVEILDDVFSGVEQEDEDNRRAIVDGAIRASALLSQVFGIWAALAARVGMTTVSRYLVGSSAPGSVLSSNLKAETAGNVTESPRGFLEDLRLAMVDNTGGSGGIDVGSPTRTGTLTFPGAWTGRGANPTLTDRAIPGTILVTCIKGLDAKAPTFRVTETPTDPRRRDQPGAELQAEVPLTIGQLWQSQRLGISAMTIRYSAVVTNTTANQMATTATLWDVTGLTDALSDAGKLWGIFDGTTANFYSSETARDADDATSSELVTQATSCANNTAFVSADLGNGLVVSGTAGSAIADNGKFEVDFAPPNATASFSYAQIAVAETDPGSVWQALVREGAIGLARYRLASNASPTIGDGFVTRVMATGGRRFSDDD